ncbi:putative DNA primase small subunit [Dichotomocladium elegans]|nr:putative DNA primase small subunit [Dichotomocladium elegans]
MTEEQHLTSHSELDGLNDEIMNDLFEDYEESDRSEIDRLTTVNRKMQNLSTNDHGPAVPQYDPVFLLRFFYERLFPYKLYTSWLSYSYSPTKLLTNREFSFTLASDVYLRYNSFATEEQLRNEIHRFQPSKIDIGAVYNVPPNMKKRLGDNALKPVEKELVFDIDMTDYDDIRTCCSGGDVCNKCWGFMTVAIKVIDASLREDFGFKHLLWVYSGRRGVHCWVSDERARKLSNESRKAIVNFLEVVKGSNETAQKVKLPFHLHPSLERSLEILKPYFSELILEGQGVLDSPEQWIKEWSRNPSLTGMEKWTQLSQALLTKNASKQTLRDILLQYCYPRLDDKVSIQINHLLKSPFCVHPKTQRVCVPIDPEKCEAFDPLKVPTLQSLMTEYEDFESRKASGGQSLPDYNKTSLGIYIDIFKKFVDGAIREQSKKRKDEQGQSMEF